MKKSIFVLATILSALELASCRNRDTAFAQQKSDQEVDGEEVVHRLKVKPGWLVYPSFVEAQISAVVIDSTVGNKKYRNKMLKIKATGEFSEKVQSGRLFSSYYVTDDKKVLLTIWSYKNGDGGQSQVVNFATDEIVVDLQGVSLENQPNPSFDRYKVEASIGKSRGSPGYSLQDLGEY
jgi:hypothetical protein